MSRRPGPRLVAALVALARVLPRSASVTFAAGCHDGSFFASRQYASLAFLGAHLAATG